MLCKHDLSAGLNQYSAQIGLEELRVEISRFYERFHKSKYDHNSEIVVTTSGQEALACIMQVRGQGGTSLGYLIGPTGFPEPGR